MFASEICRNTSSPKRSATAGNLSNAGDSENVQLNQRFTIIAKKTIGRCLPLLRCFLLCFAFLVALLLLGEDRERRLWHSIKPHHHLYTSKTVCAIGIFDGAPGTMLIKDLVDDHRVLHCGTCGQCSSKKDISIYFDTRNTLTAIATNAAKVMLFSRSQYLASLYLKQQADMSDTCVDCWVRNIACTLNNCLSTCFKHRMLPFLPSLPGVDVDTLLDACHACDERLCGPNFVECAGANRRRAGIVSDIQRDTLIEVCPYVNMEWILQETRNEGLFAKPLQWTKEL